MTQDATARSAVESLADLNRRLLEGMAQPLTREGAGFDIPELFRSLTAGYADDADTLLALQQRFYARHWELWNRYTGTPPETPQEPMLRPPAGDRRFRAPEWQTPYFGYLVQSYLLSAEFMQELVDRAKLDDHTRNKLSFVTRQYLDALAPSNFPWSNPEALKLALETRGESLTKGLENLRADLPRGLVSMTDASAFEVGRNLAVTPGAVVYENDFMQLLQYAPLTDTVYRRPLVMIPPCINKYYILDMQEENSFVRYAVSQGHTVFMVSWRNMPAEMGTASWDDYLEQGVMAALHVAAKICNVRSVNALGFCVGGTLLGSALAVMRAKKSKLVASLSLLATMLDFSDTGELSVFVDRAYVEKRERDFAEGGLLHGRELALTFASLRANDLIWQYVVNNYLKGRTPDPFDLLYWNSDSTNLPGRMYAYYIRNMYLENNLRQPGRLTMCGTPVDLSVVDMPAYLVAAREDHIVPWQTAYASTQLLGGKMRFVLAASGHIAGMVNPALRNRRSYWSSTGDELPADAEAWLGTAEQRPGSWWTDWSAWLAQHGGSRRAARSALGSTGYPVVEPAPGRYVRMTAA